MEIYVSQYLNMYVSHQDTMILFSGVSGAIDEIDLLLGKELKKAKIMGQPIPSNLLSKFSESEISFLIKRGHLTKLNQEEEHKVFCRYVDKMHGLLNQQREKTGSLMIIPSYYCNLACPYCFQDHLHSASGCNNYKFMTSKAVDDVFQKAIPQLFPKITKMNRISICIYGGEPFVPENREAIDAIMRYTTKYQMPVSAISNATQVHNFLEYFGNKSGLVNSVQISFDGDKQFHDTSRIGRNKEGTFERILENIHKLVDIKARVGIRMNTTRMTMPSIQTFVKRLEEEELLNHPMIHVYAWAVHCHGQIFDRAKYLTNWELSNVVETYSKSVESPIGRRERRLKGVINAEGGLVMKRTAFCMRSVPYAYLIDVFNDIYGCYEEAGNKKARIGSFSVESGLKWEECYQKNLSRHVAKCNPCSRCSMALTCGGGCPYAATTDHGNQFNNDCDSHKECVARAIQRLFKEKSSESAEQQARAADDLDLYPNA